MTTNVELVTILDNAIKAGAPAHVGAASSGQIMPSTFCTAWPVVKPILQTIGAVVTWVPVYGVTASLVWNGLLTIAQNLYDTECVVTPAVVTPPASTARLR